MAAVRASLVRAQAGLSVGILGRRGRCIGSMGALCREKIHGGIVENAKNKVGRSVGLLCCLVKDGPAVVFV